MVSNTNGKRTIYEIEYKGKRLTLFLVGVGSPVAVGDLEDLHAMGCNKFVIFGNCGVLDRNIDDCSIIIPTKAFRDEGTSYHYQEESDTIELNKKYQKELLEIDGNTRSFMQEGISSSLTVKAYKISFSFSKNQAELSLIENSPSSKSG